MDVITKLAGKDPMIIVKLKKLSGYQYPLKKEHVEKPF